MKRIFSIILLLTSCSLSAQFYPFPLKKLSKDFGEFYGQTDKTQNFYARLSDASIEFFSSENKLFTSAVTNIAKELKINIDSSAGLVFDSVMNNYIQNHLWDTDIDVLEKNKELFSYYNSKMCPCVSEKIKYTPHGILDEKGAKDCVSSLITDTSYLNTLRKIAGSKTINELFDISQQAGLFAMQHCFALRQYFVGLVKSSSVDLYLYKIKNRLTNADYVIFTLYQKNDIAGLIALFPEYKKFESHIKQMNAFLSKGRFTILPKQETTTSGLLNFIKTYYIYQTKKPVIVGQVLYTIKEFLPDAPVLSLKFNSPDRIINKKEIYKELGGNEMIQPPTEPPPGVKIVEVVPKKN